MKAGVSRVFSLIRSQFMKKISNIRAWCAAIFSPSLSEIIWYPKLNYLAVQGDRLSSFFSTLLQMSLVHYFIFFQDIHSFNLLSFVKHTFTGGPLYSGSCFEFWTAMWCKTQTCLWGVQCVYFSFLFTVTVTRTGYRIQMELNHGFIFLISFHQTHDSEKSFQFLQRGEFPYAFSVYLGGQRGMGPVRCNRPIPTTY